MIRADHHLAAIAERVFCANARQKIVDKVVENELAALKQKNEEKFQRGILASKNAQEKMDFYLGVYDAIPAEGPLNRKNIKRMKRVANRIFFLHKVILRDKTIAKLAHEAADSENNVMDDAIPF